MRWNLGFGGSSSRYEKPRRAELPEYQQPEFERVEARPETPAEAAPQPSPPPPPQPARRPPPLSQLDEMGQRGEMLRVRVTQLADRLDEIRSLPTDFAAIVEPLAAITAELPKARVRNAELEGLLGREREVVGDLRRRVSEQTTRGNTAATELLGARTELQRVEAALRDREAEVQELRGGLHERSQVAADLERQFAAEMERARTLQAENKVMRAEVQALDQSVTRATRDLAETRERLALSDQEGRRVQLVGEEQAARITDLVARADTLAEEGGAARERLHAAEGRLAAEIAAREKVETQAQAELGALRAEVGNVAMRMEAASSRATALDRLLAQVRAQLREREETVRLGERAAKEAETERASQDRRIEVVQAELARAGERWAEAQQSRVELDGRCDMLAKALAAKDAALDQALGRATTLTDHTDQLARRGEAERAELEVAIRRLTEELHNERSERALARGALEIARESRATLQRQYEALKRGRTEAAEAAAAPPAPAGPPAADEAQRSNVRVFPPQDRS